MDSVKDCGLLYKFWSLILFMVAADSGVEPTHSTQLIGYQGSNRTRDCIGIVINHEAPKAA